jgi:hypothetical protein
MFVRITNKHPNWWLCENFTANQWCFEAELVARLSDHFVVIVSIALANTESELII